MTMRLFEKSADLSVEAFFNTWGQELHQHAELTVTLVQGSVTLGCLTPIRLNDSVSDEWKIQEPVTINANLLDSSADEDRIDPENRFWLGMNLTSLHTNTKRVKHTLVDSRAIYSQSPPEIVNSDPVNHELFISRMNRIGYFTRIKSKFHPQHAEIISTILPAMLKNFATTVNTRCYQRLCFSVSISVFRPLLESPYTEVCLKRYLQPWL